MKGDPGSKYPQRKILVVDDNRDAVAVIRLPLESRGFEVDVAFSGKEALKRLEEGSLPDVVLLDIMMPSMSGLEVLEHVRSCARMAEVPVIFVTAKTKDEDVLEGYRSGADYYITKPFTTKQLLYGIGLVLGDSDMAEEFADGRL